MAGIQTNHIPYRGSAPMLTDLIGGRIHYAFDGVSTSLGYIRGGHRAALGSRQAFGARRSCRTRRRSPKRRCRASTAASGSACLRRPARRRAVVELMNSKVNAALATPEVKENFAQARHRAGRRRPGRAGRDGAGGDAEMGGDRARQEHPYRAISGEPRHGCSASARCISACSCSAPATIRPAGAIEGATASSCSWPVMQTSRASPSAASSTCSSSPTGWRWTPAIHPSFVVAVRADHAARRR